MASPIASTSRIILRKSASFASRSGRQSSSRLFSTSSPATQREIAFRVANVKAIVQLPSLPAWLSGMIRSTADDASYMPAFAGAQSEALAPVPDDAFEWDGMLHAVPKSKISHSRKAMRHANKGLKDRVDFVHCAACGKPKLAHHICAHCYSFISRTQKQEARLEQNQSAKQGQEQQE